jgi:hypothetical protein
MGMALRSILATLLGDLFAGSLRPVLVTPQRHAKARGYLGPQPFTGRVEETAVHELAMNPDSFTGPHR